MLSIGGSNFDVNYRYKMPPLRTKIEGRGNGIKTVILNMSDVAKSLHVSPEYPSKYFGFELGTISKFEKDFGRAIVNGAHQASDLQKLLEKFIQLFVLCPVCKLPEIKLVVKNSIKIDCAACGHNGVLQSRHKLVTFIMNNPPKKKDKENDAESENGASAAGPKEVLLNTSGGIGDLSEDGSAPESKMKDKKDKKDKEKDKEKKVKKVKKLKPKENENDEEEENKDKSKKKVAKDSDSTKETESEKKPKSAEKKEKSKKKKKKEDEESTEVPDVPEKEKKAVKAEKKELTKFDSALSVFVEFMSQSSRSVEEAFGELKRIRLSRQLDITQTYTLLLRYLFSGKQSSSVVLENCKKQMPLFKKLNEDTSSSMLLLSSIEEVLGRYDTKLSQYVPHLLQMFYHNEVLSEDSILTWESVPAPDAAAATVRNKAKPFIVWLRTAEEEEEEDGDS